SERPRGGRRGPTLARRVASIVLAGATEVVDADATHRDRCRRRRVPTGRCVVERAGDSSHAAWAGSGACVDVLGTGGARRFGRSREGDRRSLVVDLDGPARADRESRGVGAGDREGEGALAELGGVDRLVDWRRCALVPNGLVSRGL